MRLIDADALFKEFEKTAWYDNADRDEIAEEILLQMPTIDAVEVVRCKDCKHSGMYAFGDESGGEVLACLTIEEDGFVRFATGVDPDHFCSYGERKE